jgi:hypothetical protein
MDNPRLVATLHRYGVVSVLTIWGATMTRGEGVSVVMAAVVIWGAAVYALRQPVVEPRARVAQEVDAPRPPDAPRPSKPLYGTRITQPAVCAPSDSALSEVLRVGSRSGGDRDEVAAAIIATGSDLLQVGTKIRVLDYGPFRGSSKVLVIRSASTCYVVNEALR